MKEEMREKITEFLFMWIFILPSFVEGGICWNSISESGNCQNILKMNVTKEQCCSTTNQPNVGWTPSPIPTSGLIFFWEYLSNGAPMCRRCHNSCDDITCPKNMKCLLKKNIPKCVCKPKCSSAERKSGPLCGTDMIKYKNYCNLLRHNCKYRTEITVDYYGKCKDSCRNLKCPPGRFCVEDQNGLPHCINCSSDCPSGVQEPVCGDNLQTYQSPCHLKAELCKNGIPLQIAYPGPCRNNATCPTVNCPHFMDCLVNPVTKQPFCANCRKQCSPLSVVPVCGTDSVTYKNFCEMRRVSCNIRVLIQTKHSGRCHKKKHGCRGCKGPLKSILRRRKIRRRRKWKIKLAAQYSEFKSNVYRGYTIFPQNKSRVETSKMDNYKENG